MNVERAAQLAKYSKWLDTANEEMKVTSPHSPSSTYCPHNKHHPFPKQILSRLRHTINGHLETHCFRNLIVNRCSRNSRTNGPKALSLIPSKVCFPCLFRFFSCTRQDIRLRHQHPIPRQLFISEYIHI